MKAYEKVRASPQTNLLFMHQELEEVFKRMAKEQIAHMAAICALPQARTIRNSSLRISTLSMTIIELGQSRTSKVVSLRSGKV